MSSETERDLVAIEARRAEIRERFLQPTGQRPASSARGLHHTALVSSDVERTVRFYQEVLGFRLRKEHSAVDWSTRERTGGDLWLGEVVATFGLLIVILGIVRARRTDVVAFAVGGYIAAAYWFTSSTSFANPAVTIARTATDTFTGIAPADAPAFIVAQVVGALGATALAAYLFTDLDPTEVVVPHPTETQEPTTP